VPFKGSCPAACEAKKCDVCNTWADIVKEYAESQFDENAKKKAQFGEDFMDPWLLVASHQCHDFHHCKAEKGTDPDLLPGGPFKDPKYGSVPYGHKCKGEPAGGWGNLGKCLEWKDCFQKCLDKSTKAGSAEPDAQCNLLHFEVGSGRCTSYTTDECTDKSALDLGDAPLSKYSTEPTEGMVVMKAYHEDQDALRSSSSSSDGRRRRRM